MNDKFIRLLDEQIKKCQKYLSYYEDGSAIDLTNKASQWTMETENYLKYAVENQLVDKCIRRARGETVKISPMIEKLLELNSLETMRKTVLPYLNEKLTDKAVKGAKDIMFDAVADTVKKWGNEKFIARKLDMPDQYMVMALLKECEEKRGIYLKSSRSQRVRRLIEKNKEGK